MTAALRLLPTPERRAVRRLRVVAPLDGPVQLVLGLRVELVVLTGQAERPEGDLPVAVAIPRAA